MSMPTLDDNLGIFYEEMDERLKTLTTEQQQWYLEGLYHAFDTYFRLANPGFLEPMEREQFMGAAKSWVYSKTYHLKLDATTRMKPLMESGSDGEAKSYAFALMVHKMMGIPPDPELEIQFHNVMGVYALDKMKERQQSRRDPLSSPAKVLIEDG